MNDETAIEGLKRLGLTTYESRVFLALQKLGTGTASEVSEIVEVPRSQVYGAADGLEERGLVERQQSTPTVYRPVALDQARDRLLDQLAQTGSETFDYLETVTQTETQREQSEAIWLVNGRDAVVSRTVTLAEEADDRLLYAADSTEMLVPAVLDALRAAAERGVTVVVVSADPAVHDALDSGEPFQTFRVPKERDLDVSTGRVLLADDATLLLSTFSVGNEPAEVAFWTAETAFASVLVELSEAWFHNPFD